MAGTAGDCLTISLHLYAVTPVGLVNYFAWQPRTQRKELEATDKTWPESLHTVVSAEFYQLTSMHQGRFEVNYKSQCGSKMGDTTGVIFRNTV